MHSMQAAFFGHKTFPVLYSYHVKILNSLPRVKGLFIIQFHVLNWTLVGFGGRNLLVWDTVTSIIGQGYGHSGFTLGMRIHKQAWTV